MSHAFTSSADWSDYFHTTPPTAADHQQFVAVPAPAADDPNPSSFSLNSTPPASVNNPTTPRAIRVTKPARKRSRASRRTPTTLLSTDTSNFRAMVQQFTGGPSALGFGIGGAIDHPLPRRLTDHHQLPFAFPPGYSFQFQQAQQGEQARRMVEASSMASSMASIVKNDAVGNSFLY